MGFGGSPARRNFRGGNFPLSKLRSAHVRREALHDFAVGILPYEFLERLLVLPNGEGPELACERFGVQSVTD